MEIDIFDKLVENVEYTFDDWFECAYPNEFIDTPKAILMRNIWQISKESEMALNDKFPKYLFTDKKYKIIEESWNAAKNH